MNTLTKILLGTTFDKARRRIIKVLRFGLSDVKTALEASPFGIDSSPIPGMIAIYAETNDKGKNTIIGYLNKNQLSETGEMRIFSTDALGILKFYIWLKNDGTCQLGGVVDNAVRFTPLDAATDKFAQDINTELTKIQTAITGLGGAYSRLPISINIDAAKIEQITTP